MCRIRCNYYADFNWFLISELYLCWKIQKCNHDFIVWDRFLCQAKIMKKENRLAVAKGIIKQQNMNIQGYLTVIKLGSVFFFLYKYFSKNSNWGKYFSKTANYICTLIKYFFCTNILAIKILIMPLIKTIII